MKRDGLKYLAAYIMEYFPKIGTLTWFLSLNSYLVPREILYFEYPGNRPTNRKIQKDLNIVFLVDITKNYIMYRP